MFCVWTVSPEPLTSSCMLVACIATRSHPGAPHTAPASCRQQWVPAQHGWEAGSGLQALLVQRPEAQAWSSGWLGALLLLVRTRAVEDCLALQDAVVAHMPVSCCFNKNVQSWKLACV